MYVEGFTHGVWVFVGFGSVKVYAKSTTHHFVYEQYRRTYVPCGCLLNRSHRSPALSFNTFQVDEVILQPAYDGGARVHR